jgi:hypothetical protein
MDKFLRISPLELPAKKLSKPPAGLPGHEKLTIGLLIIGGTSFKGGVS